MKCKRVSKVAVCSGNISFDRVSHRIHTSVSHQFLRHSLCQFRIYDRHIWRDLKISDRIFDALFIISDDGKGRYFCCSARSGRNRTEMSFLTKWRNTKHLTHIFECDIRIFVFDPHSLRCVDRRSSTDSHDPVRFEFQHFLSSAHHGLYRRIRFDPFKQFHFHACFLQVCFYLVQETRSLHRSAPYADHRFLSGKALQCFQCTFSMINVSW